MSIDTIKSTIPDSSYQSYFKLDEAALIQLDPDTRARLSILWTSAQDMYSWGTQQKILSDSRIEKSNEMVAKLQEIREQLEALKNLSFWERLSNLINGLVRIVTGIAMIAMAATSGRADVAVGGLCLVAAGIINVIEFILDSIGADYDKDLMDKIETVFMLVGGVGAAASGAGVLITALNAVPTLLLEACKIERAVEEYELAELRNDASALDLQANEIHEHSRSLDAAMARTSAQTTEQTRDASNAIRRTYHIRGEMAQQLA